MKVRSQGIIIRTLDLTNSDKIVTLFTSQEGKLSLVAKRAQSSLKRFGGALELLNRVSIEYSDKGDSKLGVLEYIDILESYSFLKKDYDKIMMASYFIDLYAQVHPEKLQASNSYKLLTLCLEYLNTDAEPGDILAAFQIKLLCALGLRPNYHTCELCGKKITSGANNFYYDFNEIYCQNCSSRGGRNISFGTLEFIDSVVSLPIKDFLGMKVKDGSLRELSYYVDYHMDMHLGKHLKSRDMIPDRL